MQQGDDLRAVLGSDSNSDCFHLFAPPLWHFTVERERDSKINATGNRLNHSSR
jgi:hypothetical protein